MSEGLLPLVEDEWKRVPVHAAPVRGVPAIAEGGARGPSLMTSLGLVEGRQQDVNVKKESLPWDLSETMTVGEAVTRYPAAGPVLEHLCSNPTLERYDCLDEVAWRHGMESRELLARLEEELARGLTPESQRASGVPGVECRGDAHARRSPVRVEA